MATLGNQTIGNTFSISGSFGDVAGGPYTVPSPGIYATKISVEFGNNGSSTTGRLYIWKDNSGLPGVWLLRSGTIALGGMGLQQRTDINVNSGQIAADGYLPAGTKIWIGYYSSSGISSYQGNGTGSSELGNTADGNWSDHGPSSSGGVIGAYIDYTALAAPTISNVSPATAPDGSVVTLTGTGFLHATGITVNGVTAPTYTINSDTSISLTIPAGASGTGNIVVTTPAGTASYAFTAGQVYWGDTSGNGTVHTLVAVWYGDPSGNGTPHQSLGTWVPVGSPPTGVKRIF